MSPKTLMLIFATVGSIVGGYIPTLWGASLFSMSSWLFGAIGTALGVWLVFKLQGY
ncbi:MAG TPA: hypothetical protein VG753_00465 [Candidatus Paceibacterota bacterium]|nr:hypothetical protein [Candidatus Paceibacterota bacterium]